MKVKVLLIQPYQRLTTGKKKKYGSIMPPLGLLSLVSCIRKDCKNAEVSFFDYEVKNGEDEPDFSCYDMIGLSGTSVHIPHVALLIKDIRASNENVCIFMGGPHATFAYDSLLKTIPDLDVVIRGEGELSTVYLINHYTDRFHIPQYPGIITKKILTSDNDVHMSPVVQDLDILPGYAFDVVNIKKYQLSTHRKSLRGPFISYMTSRGCPFSCSYCQTPNMFGKNLRFRSPNVVYQDCKRWQEKLGYNSIVFWDDTFIANRNYTVELCALLKQLQVDWMCNTRVDRVDEELLHIMKDSGCKVIFFGVESFKTETLKFLNRTTTEDAVICAFSLCRKVGIQTVAAFMVGTPYDSLRSIEESKKKLKALNPDNVYISIYNATVGSKEFERAVMSGIIKDDIDWSNPNLYNSPPYGLPTISTNLSRYQLQKAQKSIYREFYGKGNEGQYE